MMEGVRTPRWLGPAALVVFALSGCSGLIYQSIWTQYLGLYLGHAAYAQSLVLAIFMGGMAVGAWWASRRSLRWRNLLFAYAAVELVIGIAAALFHPVYVGVTGFAYDTAFPALPAGWVVQAFKWASGALLILPQAILLGSTFPLMSSGLMRRLHGSDGAILSGLYFTNSIGAALGALLATFVLLPAIGMPGAMRFGACLNIVVALAAFLLGCHGASPAQAEPPRRAFAVPAARLLLAAAFVTGATSFVYEIGWVRMLSLAFGSTVHAFELMLAAFIGGLAFGGLWIRRRIDGYETPIRIGGWVQMLMGLSALASLVLYDHSFDWVAWFLHALSRTDGGYDLYNAVTAVVSILLMAPAAFFAGMTLPLFTLTLIRAGGGEASVGRIYAANTIGAIVGVFAAVHLLVPGLGLKLAMIAAAAGDLVLGLVLLRRAGRSDAPTDLPYLGGLVLCGVALAVTMVAARFDPAAMSAGVYRRGEARFDANGPKVLFYRDGKTASVAVQQIPNGTRAIATNGKVDAGIGFAEDGKPSRDEITMVMAGLAPLLHHDDPRTAAVIGFGSGLSTHTLLADPRLERVDTIEIEPSMIEGARLFGKHVERAYNDRRSHFHIEDARTYFAANRSKYDIILSEPSNPWVSGVASLFSREFYEFVPRHLAPGGLFVQWVQLYEINDELVATVANALSERFADFRIYLAYDTDMLIVARVDGPVGEIHPQVLATPAIHAIAERLDIATAPEFLAHQIGDKKSMAPLFTALSRRKNSDFYPILSLEAPRTRFTHATANVFTRLALADLPYREVLAGLAPPAADSVHTDFGFAYTHGVQQAGLIARALLDEASDARKGDLNLAYLHDVVGRCEHAIDPGLALNVIAEVASNTLGYLEPATRRSLWVSPSWIRCDAQPEPVRHMLAVISALAARDGATAEAKATALLRDEHLHALPALRDWLLRAAMLAAIDAGHFASVERLEAEFGKDIDSNPIESIYRVWMRNYARGQLPGARSTH
ncbi:MAG TPA: spermine synthase [Dokdonella sp.]|nr:spermine synthase [Dokdonella sp.]